MTLFIFNLLLGAAIGWAYWKYAQPWYGEFGSQRYWLGLLGVVLLSFPISFIEHLLGF